MNLGRVSLIGAVVVALFASALPVFAGVQVQLIDSSPTKNENAWPEKVVFEYRQPAFAFTRLPQAYTKDGLRDEWPNPLLVRVTAQIELPADTHRILLRSRRAARLFIDGELIAENPFPPKIRDGHDSVDRPFIPLGSDVRFPGLGDQEKLVQFTFDGGTHHIRLDFFVGGFAGNRVMRPETGETLVALSLEDESMFNIVSPERPVPLTDAAWEELNAEQHAALDHSDTKRRQNLQASRNDYWKKRHAFARQIAEERMGAIGDASVDNLVESQIRLANQSIDNSPQAKQFRENIRPLLNDRCASCHGKKAKGGLNLSSPASAQKGGESEFPAIVPGNPEESLLLELVASDDEDERMPPKGDPLTDDEVDALRRWIADGAVWPETTLTEPVELASLTDDWQFLRRVHLDTVGVPPTADELRTFVADTSDDKRSRMIDQLLNDERWADHWVGYWQDVLAENPTIVNPTLNNTGPFRWWIYDSFRDNKPMDRFVTELVMMEGSLQDGGPRGFEMASQNDVPMAAKANVLATAFLATEMKCSRCHDAPFHDNTQRDLFGLAAMLAQKSLAVPTSSSVPKDKLHTGGRKPLIQVTLEPGTKVEPAWAFNDWAAGVIDEKWLSDPKNTRERLAFHLTSPHNPRFAKVVVNRLWQRLLGRGIVEPVDDWENASPSNPELLDYLAAEFLRSGYDLKTVARLILNSKTYQRQTNEDADAIRYFASPGPRRMSAEQIIDSLFSAVGKKLKTEPLTVDIGGGRPWHNAVNLGTPTRAWMFGGMANNRDRPSLILPRAQAVIDVMRMFGWRPSRQEPTSYRKSPLSPLQPAALNNGTVTTWLTRLSDDHLLTNLALEQQAIGDLVNTLYARILNRPPRPEEMIRTMAVLHPGFDSRVVEGTEPYSAPRPYSPPLFVTWANHLHPEATGIQLEEARKARAGDPPSLRLTGDWRERMEDVVWALINLPETIYYP